MRSAATGAVSIFVAAVALTAACGSGLGTPPPTRVPGSSSSAVPSDAESPQSPASGTPEAGPSFRALTDFPVEGAFEVTGVVATAEGFVAVGFGAADGHEDYFGPRQGIVWRSADGQTWHGLRDSALANVTPLDIAALGGDLFILGALKTCAETRTGCSEVPEAGNAIWRSSAGGPWQRLPPPAGMQQALAVDGLIADTDMLMAFGSAADESETPTVWNSSDGQTWSQTSALADLDPVTALAATPNGFVAFGTVARPEGGTAELAAAVSPDGSFFGAAVVPLLPDAAVDDVVFGAGGLVGVGHDFTGEGIDLRALALFSADGSAWVEGSATDGSFTDAYLVAAHAVPAGYVAIGFQVDDSDFAVQAGQAWISADGQRWRSMGSIGEASLITASAAGTPGLVVFSADQFEDETGVTSTIAAWFSPASALSRQPWLAAPVSVLVRTDLQSRSMPM